MTPAALRWPVPRTSTLQKPLICSPASHCGRSYFQQPAKACDDYDSAIFLRRQSSRPCCGSRLARLLTVSTPVAGGLVAVDADDDLLEGFECVDEPIDR